MPQMAPLMWLTLFIVFILIFLFFNSLNYFNLNFKNSNNKDPLPNNNKQKNLIWKW